MTKFFNVQEIHCRRCSCFDIQRRMILYEDPYLLVIEKPEGLLSVPGRGLDKADCLIARIQAQIPEALIIHRLDMATSGLMVLARSVEMHRALSMAFAERRVSKSYTALVQGQMECDDGEVTLPLITDWPNRPRQKVDHELGKPSITRYRVLNRMADHTRVRLDPITGRSHQLRVHMSEIGHAIFGDPLYGQREAKRLMLHANWLAFEHPIRGKTMDFHSPVPF